MMHHHIAAARFGCNETKTLLVVKPFHLPHRHLRNPFLSLRGSAATMSRKLCPFCTSSAVKLNNNDGYSAKQAESAAERQFSNVRSIRCNHGLSTPRQAHIGAYQMCASGTAITNNATSGRTGDSLALAIIN